MRFIFSRFCSCCQFMILCNFLQGNRALTYCSFWHLIATAVSENVFNTFEISEYVSKKNLPQMHWMKIVWSPISGIIYWLATLFEHSCQLKFLCEYLSVLGKRMSINILLNAFQLCSKQSVPCRETETESSCHVTTESSHTHCWTGFHTNKIQILHPPPQLGGIYSYLPQPMFHPHLAGRCVWRFSLYSV